MRTSRSSRGTFLHSRPSSRFLRTVRCGQSARSWNTMAIPSSSGGKIARPPSLARASPMRIAPCCGITNPAMARRSIVLPEPELPRTASVSPAGTWSETSASARRCRGAPSPPRARCWRSSPPPEEERRARGDDGRGHADLHARERRHDGRRPVGLERDPDGERLLPRRIEQGRRLEVPEAKHGREQPGRGDPAPRPFSRQLLHREGVGSPTSWPRPARSPCLHRRGPGSRCAMLACFLRLRAEDQRRAAPL